VQNDVLKRDCCIACIEPLSPRTNGSYITKGKRGESPAISSAETGVLTGTEPICDVDTREYDLTSNDSPRGTPSLALDQALVEPILLSTTHETSPSVVIEGVDVIWVSSQHLEAE
jgi:hypothetical protein